MNNWFFIDTNIITEDTTSFTIRLNAGSWRNPIDITPDSAGLSAREQARLLREGLAFANEALSIKMVG